MIELENDSRTPWQPAGLRLPRVGDRVRVRLGGECDQDFEAVGVHSERREDLETHPSVLDGQPATVISCAGWDNAHRYDVRFDPPVRRPNGRLTGSALFAAIELEILADDDGGTP